MAENTFGAGQAGANAFPDPESLSYEQARAELVETVKILELGQMSLDESLKYWERGEALAKRCEVLLQGAARRVEAVVGEREEASSSADDPDNADNSADAE
ncbi:exodeoxyribonuclease VII small subunit [Corynebacterium glaucum]|uniref:exodeoxyribonuclease VII small subunit n=1 Tax=Corynebacterium glaucum TaxID=187491 RepID=UPI0025B2B68E|nr:exodeoxyribonuclease VII small subunit [Corynebacterium glaucum]WJZ07369.1 Exodeoxyribonuclease 7 small subunit [Corynebacterium glaucum]